MNEQTENQTLNETADELSALKERARILGITFSNNIGLDALRKRVNDKINGLPEEPEVAASSEPVAPRELTQQEIREQHIAENMALLRCKIYNLNPDKRDLKGEIITVVNRFLGKVQKFIPFGEETDNGYHIPKVIYDDLVQRQYQEIRTKEKRDGKTEIIRRMAPEYNIVVLPQLTEEELQELALKQAAAERVGA